MDVYNNIEECIKLGEVEHVEKLITEAINTKYPAHRILEKGLLKGINSITYELEHGQITVPEVLVSAMTMQLGIDTLKPYLNQDKEKELKALIGTVEGDLHDIGKDIVKVLIESVGIEVIDLGVDVSASKFVEAVQKEKPDLLLISALLTTTIHEMDKIIKELVKKKLRKDITIFIGGKSVDKQFCESIGADYYFDKAVELRDFITGNRENFKNKKR